MWHLEEWLLANSSISCCGGMDRHGSSRRLANQGRLDTVQRAATDEETSLHCDGGRGRHHTTIFFLQQVAQDCSLVPAIRLQLQEHTAKPECRAKPEFGRSGVRRETTLLTVTAPLFPSRDSSTRKCQIFAHCHLYR